jgi:hypothetical protein
MVLTRLLFIFKSRPGTQAAFLVSGIHSFTI